jgi:hypothetical protein
MIIPPQHLKRRHRREMIPQQLPIHRHHVMLARGGSKRFNVWKILPHWSAIVRPITAIDTSARRDEIIRCRHFLYHGHLARDSRYSVNIDGNPPIQQSRKRKDLAVVSLARLLFRPSAEAMRTSPTGWEARATNNAHTSSLLRRNFDQLVPQRGRLRLQISDLNNAD